jgi:hypothetical protein
VNTVEIVVLKAPEVQHEHIAAKEQQMHQEASQQAK